MVFSQFSKLGNDFIYSILLANSNEKMQELFDY